MPAIGVSHRVALLAAVLLGIGGLGPWATGVWNVDPQFEPPTYGPRDAYGGWPVAVAALVAASALLLVPEPRARSRAAAVVFALSAGLCVAGWLTRTRPTWLELGSDWGLLLATLASLVGVVASLAGAPKREAWDGAPS